MLPKVIDDASRPEEFGGYDHGLIPRNFGTHPPGYFCPTFSGVNFELTPQSQWSAIIKEKTQRQSRTSDVLRRANYGAPIKALYQDGWGYCWFYSAGHAVTAVRALAHLPYKVLSPFAGAHIIKRGANQGGWCGLSAEWVMKHGIPDISVWPNLKRGLDQDTPAMRSNAALNRITEGFIDLDAAAYDRNLSFAQLATLLLANIPVQVDFNWWGHSVCALDLVEVEPGSFGIVILNSHGEDYEGQLMTLRGNRAIPNGAVGLSVVMAA